MTTAYQLPVHESPSTKVGHRLYRKQILPISSIKYKGRRLDFSRPFLKKVVDNFDAGAYDQVAFQMADAANTHTLDPERFRGEVRALELADDGLYALLDLSADGEAAVAKNPRLGVSVRIVPELERADGKKFGPSLNHVLGTLDPRIVGMKPWQPVDLAASDMTVVDLTAETFHQEEPMSDTAPTLTDEDAARMRALLDAHDKTKTPDAPKVEPVADITDAELEALLADEEKPVDIAAAADMAEAIELTRAQAEQTAIELATVQAELAVERWKGQKAAYLRDGVPPALLNVPGVAELASTKASNAIELANGTKTDVADVIHALLAAAKHTIDLSNIPLGSDVGAPDPAEDDFDKRWEKQYPTY